MRGGMRRLVLLMALSSVPFGMVGCVGGVLSVGGFIEFYLRGIGVGGALATPNVSAAAAKTPKTRQSVPVQFTGSIGGLAGTFDVSVGGYGTLTGTAVIKGQKKAVLKVHDDSQVASLVEAMVLDVTGAAVAVTASKTVFKGSQTTGGVKKKYKCKIAWKGTAITGAPVGTPVRGKLKAKGTIE